MTYSILCGEVYGTNRPTRNIYRLNWVVHSPMFWLQLLLSIPSPSTPNIILVMNIPGLLCCCFFCAASGKKLADVWEWGSNLVNRPHRSWKFCSTDMASSCDSVPDANHVTCRIKLPFKCKTFIRVLPFIERNPLQEWISSQLKSNGNFSMQIYMVCIFPL